MRNVDTFFRGYRRETIIDGADILKNHAGEKRLKLTLKLPLSGDQLVGMPNWLGEPFMLMAKPGSELKPISSTVELDPMLLRVYALDNSEKELIAFGDVRLCSFKIDYDRSDNDQPSLVLTFSAYLPRTGKFLKFADDHFGNSVFIKYEAAQMSLLDDNPNVQPIDEPKPGDEDDGESDDDEEESVEDAPETPAGAPAVVRVSESAAKPLRASPALRRPPLKTQPSSLQ